MERYIKEVLGEDERQAVDYHDYLKMAEELGYNMREPWILFPKNLKQRHEELIEESRERVLSSKLNTASSVTLKQVFYSA